jgi:hypothetical protein
LAQNLGDPAEKRGGEFFVDHNWKVVDNLEVENWNHEGIHRLKNLPGDFHGGVNEKHDFWHHLAFKENGNNPLHAPGPETANLVD